MDSYRLACSRLMLAAFLIAFTACGDAESPPPDPVQDPPVPVSEPSAQEAEPGLKYNLNTATREEFLTIPDVGERMVHEFFEYRPYVSIQQFRREIGKYVDEAQVAAFEQYVFVPVDPDESDAETLRQLPGVDETEAAELVAGRPYGSDEAFLEKLAAYASADEVAVARTYLASR